MRHSPTIPERQRLPNRRAAETFELEVAGLHYVVSVGRFADGRLAETFITNAKAGSSADTAVGDAAIILSFALQYYVRDHAHQQCKMNSPRVRDVAASPLGVPLDLLTEQGTGSAP